MSGENKKTKKLQVLGNFGSVKTVNGVEPDKNGDVKLPTPTEDEALEMITDMGIVEPITSSSGELYTDNQNRIYVL